ncbi:MAG: hypothetical protein QOI72_943 [Solirubrobacterales bacterium]|jgi:hypothetical protein|nr:hypothetical protein [Solirubrobacterales bacterium]
MELSNDQKAILRLLAQRGAAGYDDLTALLGIGAAEVHERAKAAAAQLEADGIPAPSIPPPPAAESAAEPAPAPKPATPEPAAPVRPPDPEPQAPAAAPVAPTPAPAPARPEPPREDPPKPPGPRPKLTLPSSSRGRAALAAGVLVVVALLVILALGGGDSKQATTAGSTSTTTASEETGSATTNPKLTQAVLGPVEGGDAKGIATFGRVKNSLALQIEAEGLAPSGKGESYTVWLYDSPRKMLPLASTTVGKNGKIGAQVQVPTEVLAYLAKETFDQIDISLTEDATLKASLAKATKEKKAPIYTGTHVLRGTISGPIIGAANKTKE